MLAHAKRHGWARQLQVVKQKVAVQSAIASYEAVADVISARKDKSRLYLSKYVEDALQTAANSDGDLEIARHRLQICAAFNDLAI